MLFKLRQDISLIVLQRYAEYPNLLNHNTALYLIVANLVNRGLNFCNVRPDAFTFTPASASLMEALLEF